MNKLAADLFCTTPKPISALAPALTTRHVVTLIIVIHKLPVSHIHLINLYRFLLFSCRIGNGVAYPMRTLIAESQSLLSCGRNSASDDDEMGGDDHQRTQSNSLALL